MKISKQCLKCNSHDVVVVPGNKNIAEGRLLLNMWGTKVLLLDKYICMNCGYYEKYAAIDKNARKWLNNIAEKNKAKNDFDEFV